MSHRHRGALALTRALGFAAPIFLAGCGECVFRGRASGSVIDQERRPVAGAKVSTCDHETPSPPAAGEAQCRVATTDDKGQFSVEAQMYRPAAFQCALHSLWVQKQGCQDLKQPLTQPPDPKLVVTLSCPGGGPAPAPTSGSAPLAAP